MLNRTRLASAFLASALIAAPALAEIASPKYTMTVFSDSAYGDAIIAGQYEKAVDRLTSIESRIRGNVAAQNNLCVALAKTAQLDQARSACDAAVRNAEHLLRAGRNGSLYLRVARETDLAISLSNRAVLLVAIGEKELASQDLDRAVALETRIDAPEVNLARLGR